MLIYITILLQLLTVFSTPASAPVLNAGVAARDYCKIYGSVYLEKDPKYKNTASHSVFIEKEEAFANLIVFKEKNKLFADGTAIWYITPNKAFADHVLFVTDNRNLANFSVYFTEVRSFAACRD